MPRISPSRLASRPVVMPRPARAVPRSRAWRPLSARIARALVQYTVDGLVVLDSAVGALGCDFGQGHVIGRPRAPHHHRHHPRTRPSTGELPAASTNQTALLGSNLPFAAD